jgi:hypothetical protein
MLSIWNLDFRIGAGLCGTHRRYDPINVLLHHRPSRTAQDHNRNDSLREILLITNVLVGCQKYFKSRIFRRPQQVAVAKRIPAKILGLFDCMVLEERPKRCWRAVVEGNKHLAVSGSFETAGSKLQDRCDLFSGQVEPFHDVLYAGPCFEIFEDRGDWHARATEDPGTAYLPGYAFDRGTLGPIERWHETPFQVIVHQLAAG